MAKAQPAQQTRITRGDLESKFRAFQGEVQGKVDDKKQALAAAGAGIGMFLMLVFFLLGRRIGKKKTTLVEIRRV
ncbi:MAG: hypothetical protein ACRDZZ_09455 [Ilumatobacteraceae bacterium]